MGPQVKAKVLIDAAIEARKHSYSPYSRFAVGAALLTESGEIFQGCNVENVSFGLTICAERTATTSAILNGHRRFLALAIVADSMVPIVPCGACRQFLAEFSPEKTVYSRGKGGDQKEWLLSLLLPMPRQGILEAGQTVLHGTIIPS